MTKAVSVSCLLLVICGAIQFTGGVSVRAESLRGLEDGLVGHWRLDEQAGERAKDRSPSGLDGIIVGGPQRTDGPFGSALKLNGSTQTVMIPHSEKLRPKRQITISGWVLPQTLRGARVIYRKEDGEDRHLLAFHEDGKLLAFGVAPRGKYKELSVPIPSGSLYDERWHLVTATYDGRAKRIYWDGVEVGSEPASGTLSAKGTELAYIGSFSGGHEFFDGGICDVRLYDRALSSHEISRLYAEASAEVERLAASARASLAEAEAKRDGIWYQEAVRALRPFEPEVQARWAIGGFMTTAPRRLDGKEGHYRTVFGCSLLPRVTRDHAQWDVGDCTGRAILSWLALREMTGDTTTGRDVEHGQREFLLAHLNPDTGLVYYATDPAKKVFHYQIWDQSRTLRALVQWYKTQPEDRGRIGPLVERMIAGLERFSTLHGTDPVWGPWASWPSDEFTNDKPGSPLAPVIDNLREGISIEPLVQYAEWAKSDKSLDLAIRYANCVMGGHAGDNVPPAQRRVFQIAEDGSFIQHFHCKTTSLIGITKLARHLASQSRLDEAKRYLHRVRASYDWILSPDNPGRASRIGWVPERPGAEIHETCCVADLMELTEALASCSTLAPEFHDWANLHDNVESMAVNVVARSQIHFTPKFESRLAEFYRRNGLNPEEQLAAARVFEGLMPAVIYHNDLVWGAENDVNTGVWPSGAGAKLVCGGCCMYSGVIALYTGWRDAMSFSDGQLRINYFLNRKSPEAVMTTKQPVAGEAEVLLHQAADVMIRIPTWLTPQQLSISVDGQQRDVAGRTDPTGHYLRLGQLPAGGRIQIRFPLEERITTEHFAGRRYRVVWRGNYVVQLGPRDARIFMFFPRDE